MGADQPAAYPFRLPGRPRILETETGQITRTPVTGIELDAQLEIHSRVRRPHKRPNTSADGEVRLSVKSGVDCRRRVIYYGVCRCY